MKNYESLGDALSDLKKKGYEDDFATESFCLYCSDLDMRLDPEDFHVDEIDRVEGNSNPNDSATVYAISSAAGVKGTLVVDADDAHSANAKS
ncbi:MAG TPA: phosphoribosylpyrophosphate synthetase [Chryseolinea sp.]